MIPISARSQSVTKFLVDNNKKMFQNSAARLLVPAIRNGLQQRCQSVIAGPPVNKVSTAEKIILGGGMCVSMLVVPAWVLLNLKDYKGGK